VTRPSFGLELLGFGPHPDDLELFCGGLFAKLAEQGHRTGIVDLTRGELGTRGTPETRAAEAEKASRALGLSHRENLAHADGTLSEALGDQTSVTRLVEVLRRLRPELVLVPWQRERHPDHEAASALVTRALFLASVKKFALSAGEPFSPRQVLYYPMRTLVEPTYVIDVSEVHGKKLQAIRCYASQVEPNASAAPTLVGSPLSMPSLVARDQFYGAQIGVSHGEPYLSREVPGLADPIDHFRRNAFARPLFFRERA
jgi:bacillithiol biosynthesis deacetylase BshB1